MANFPAAKLMTWWLMATALLATVSGVWNQGLEPSSLLSAPPFNSPSSYHQPAQPAVQPHRDVVVNAEHEALLPPHLKNPFYKNPRVAEALAQHSWFGPGETQVFDRETNHIPRQRIFSVLKNAGLARR